MTLSTEGWNLDIVLKCLGASAHCLLRDGEHHDAVLMYYGTELVLLELVLVELVLVVPVVEFCSSRRLLLSFF